jgi:endonuclease G
VVGGCLSKVCTDLIIQTHEVIGSPPTIAVPTHFAKVILASRPDFSYPQAPSRTDKGLTSTNTIKELAMGAFVLPNKEIPDQADLRSFVVPGESWVAGRLAWDDGVLMMLVEVVERAAGLELFNSDLKSKSKQLCAVTQCQVVVRRFDDARKEIGGKGKGGRN